VHVLIVGRVESAKGVGRALEICARLKHRDIQVILDIVGDGTERGAYERQAEKLGVEANFHGWLPRTALGEYYARAHFLIFPTSASEGWPKVISEAMAYGVVPITSAVSSIPQYLKQFGVGEAHPPTDLDAFVNALCGYLKDPSRWQEESRRAAEAAEKFTYSRYLEAVQKLLI
jgi:glycosyltransferase involved in cell wall biosynthesis